MLQDGLTLLGGSTIENANIESGSELPAVTADDRGRLFYIPGDAVYVCNGVSWQFASIVPASLVYRGEFDASAGTLPPATLVSEYHVYRITVGGTIEDVAYAVGDVIIWNGANIVRLVSSTELGGVNSVDGQTGNVNLSSVYLGIDAQASDSAELDGHSYNEIRQTWNSDISTAVSTKANKSGDMFQHFTAGGITTNGNILPEGNGVWDIGSPTQRFRGLYVDEAYLSTNTLYIGDTPILGTDADTIVVKADIDQSITMKTSGTGVTNVQSVAGVGISTSGMNADVQINASGTGSKVRVGAQQSIDLTAPAITAHGSLTVQNDHQVGGNLTVTGNLTVNGANTVVNAQTVEVKDNMLLLNRGQVGAGVSAGIAGLAVDRGDLADYRIIFDEADDLFKVGMVGDEEVLASRPWVTAGFSPKAHTHAPATTTVSGFMSAADKSKLDNIDNTIANRVSKSGDTMTGVLRINNSSPTFHFQDTNGLGAFLHNDANALYILRSSSVGSGVWDNGPNNRHPMTMNLANGDTVFSGNVGAYSDERLKKNIVTIDDALSKVLTMRGVYFDRISSGEACIGVIAQELQQVTPELVSEDADGYLSVNYANITAILIEALKEQQTQIDAIKHKLNSLVEE